MLPHRCRCPLSDPSSPKPPFSKENPEPKPKREKKASSPNPWDRPLSWSPSRGEENEDTLYVAVGRALTAWEVYEGYLSLLFSQFIAPTRDSIAARRAFSAVRTHEGRLEMLKAAFEAYITFLPDKNIEEAVSQVIGRSKNWSARRNDIAHGCVQPVISNEKDAFVGEFKYLLIPSYANTKDRTIHEAPKYAFTASDVLGYANGFRMLQEPVLTVFSLIQNRGHTSV